MKWKFEKIYLNENWNEEVLITTTKNGIIDSIEVNSSQIADENVKGYALPGFKNAHSHAFQYAMVGLTESYNKEQPTDDFWSWREKMYELANQLNPDQIRIVATELYRQMIRSGYTWVAEFHYIHSDSNGNPYPDRAEIVQALLTAADTVGMGITIIPIFYQCGGFNTEAKLQQKRFISKNTEEYLKLVEAAKSKLMGERQKWAYGIHSLRAVKKESLGELCRNIESGIPVHIHIAEQKREVDECVDFYGVRPIEWLLDNFSVNDNWHLVHSTHANSKELKSLVRQKAHVVLCPSTEANLGDGIFPFSDFVKLGGNWSIGSDSHILLNPLEELRWLDYGQRLVAQKRNVLSSLERNHNGEILFNDSLTSGHKAMGLNGNSIEPGQTLDLVVFEMSGLLAGTPKDRLMSTILYTQNLNCILGTITSGKWRYQRVSDVSAVSQGELAQWAELSKKIRND